MGFIFCLFVFSLFNVGCAEAPEHKTTTMPSNAIPAEPVGSADAGEYGAAPAPSRDPQTYQEVIDETQRQMDEHSEEMDIKPEGTGSSGGKSCVVLQQCDSGDDLCWNGRCWTESQLWDEYEHCQNMKCDHLECPECESSHEQCTMATSAGSKMYQVCVDCVRGTGCREGFECKRGRCV